MVLRWAKEEGLSIPVRVGAFRCEESSNFGCCTIGSSRSISKISSAAAHMASLRRAMGVAPECSACPRR